jgi:hypothetical protein
MNEHANDARPKAKPKKPLLKEKSKAKAKAKTLTLDTYQPSHRSGLALEAAL